MTGRDSELFLRMFSDDVLDRTAEAAARALSGGGDPLSYREEFGEFAQVVRGFRTIGEIDEATASSVLADCQLALALRHLPGGVLAPSGQRTMHGPAGKAVSRHPERVVPCELRYEVDDQLVTVAWIVKSESALELAVRTVSNAPPSEAGRVGPVTAARSATPFGAPGIASRLIAPVPPRLNPQRAVLPLDLVVSDNLGRTYQLATLATAGSAVERRALVAVTPMPGREVAWLEFARPGAEAVRVALDAVVAEPGAIGREEVTQSPAERYLDNLVTLIGDNVVPSWIVALRDAFVAAGLIGSDTADLGRRGPELSELAVGDVGHAGSESLARPLGLTLSLADTSVVLVGMRASPGAVEVEIYITPFAQHSARGLFADPPWFALEDGSGARIPGRFSVWGANPGGGWGLVSFSGVALDAPRVRFFVSSPTEGVYAELPVPAHG